MRTMSLTGARHDIAKMIPLLAIGALVLLLALLFSVSINFFLGPKLSIVLSGLIIGPVLLFIRLEWLLWTMVVSTFFLVGLLQYFFGIQKAFWIPYLLGTVLLVRLPIDLLTRKHRHSTDRAHRLSPPLVAFVMLMLGLTVSTLVNMPGPAQIIFGLRDYFGVLSLIIALGIGLVDRKFIEKVWMFLIWMVPVQIPVVIYQRFFVASKRVSASPWDAVVGLFGGDPEGGGGSGIMAIFVIVMSLLAFVRWRNGRMGLPFFLLVFLSALGCIAMAEVKLSFALIPLSVAIMFWREFLKKPARGLLALIMMSIVVFGIITLYKMQFSHNATRSQSVSEYLERSIKNSVDDNFVNMQTGEMGRIASLRFWEAEHGMHDPLTYFFGHGIGSTKSGGWVTGDAAAKYGARFRIDRNTASVFLWDAGLYGLLCMIALFTSAAFMAFRMARNFSLDTEARILMPVMGTASVIFLMEFPYHTSIANVPQSQLLVALVVGYVISASRLAPFASDVLDARGRFAPVKDRPAPPSAIASAL